MIIGAFSSLRRRALAGATLLSMGLLAGTALASPQPVVQIAVYDREATAWAGWEYLSSRLGDAAGGMQGAVIERGRWFTLVGVPVDGDAQAGCRTLRQAGQECFVTEADLTDAAMPAVAAAPVIETPVAEDVSAFEDASVASSGETAEAEGVEQEIVVTAAPADQAAPGIADSAPTVQERVAVGRLQLAAFAGEADAATGMDALAGRLASVFARHGGAALSVEPQGRYHIVVATAPDAQGLCRLMRQVGADCLPLPGAAPVVAEAPATLRDDGAVDAEVAAEPVVEPVEVVETPTAPSLAPASAPSEQDETVVVATEPEVAPTVPSEGTAAGMQLALYNSVDGAENGWSILSARYPELNGRAVPMVQAFGRYQALKAVASSASDRDALCAILRRGGSDCIAESVNLALAAPLTDGAIQVADLEPAQPVTEPVVEPIEEEQTADVAPETPAVEIEQLVERVEDAAEPSATTVIEEGVSGTQVTRIEVDGRVITVPTEAADALRQHLGGVAVNDNAPAMDMPVDGSLIASNGNAIPGIQAEPTGFSLPNTPDRMLPSFGAGGATANYGPSPLGPNSIVISIPDRKLQFHAPDGNVYVWPVAVARNEAYTIYGDTEVTLKRPNPTWVPTPNMRANDPSLPASVGPGPSNPLGAYALNLGFPYIRIHGTNNPDSVGYAASSGCYRMHADAIEFLFNSVDVGTRVRVSNQPLGEERQSAAVGG